MFTQPCFIRRNTPELRKKLEKLGYKRSYPDYTEHCKTIFVYQYPIKGFDTPCYTVADSFDLPYAEGSALKGRFIDCGTNESKFLALAALRDDTDKNQWFVLDTDWSSINHSQNIAPKGTFILCIKDKWSIDVLEDGSPNPISSRNIPAHKATVEELIEHFKNKK